MTAPEPIPAEKLDDSHDVKGPRFLDLREFVLVPLCLVDRVLLALEAVRLPTARANGVVEQAITSGRQEAGAFRPREGRGAQPEGRPPQRGNSGESILLD
jgi:hypothetical protein